MEEDEESKKKALDAFSSVEWNALRRLKEMAEERGFNFRELVEEAIRHWDSEKG